jgi:hypothetical protein
MDSWLIKQSKSVESDIDILGATSYTVVHKKEGRENTKRTS